MVRPLALPDIPVCLELYNRYIENTTASFEEEPLTLEAFSRRVERISQKYPFLLWEEGGKILGYAYLDAFHERSAFRYAADLSIYLAPDATGRGIGTQLYHEIEKAGKAMGITQFVSIITSENAVSRAFHEKMGFREVGTLEGVGLKFGRVLGVTYYQKGL